MTSLGTYVLDRKHTMKSVKSRESLSVLALAIVSSPAALAADVLPPFQGWYLGGNIGESKSHFDEAVIARQLQGPTLTTTSLRDDDNDLGGKLFLGYQFHRNFAVEGGYYKLGNFNFTTTTAPPGTLNGNFGVHGWNLDLVGILPFTDRFSGLARIGAANSRTTASFITTGAVPTPASPQRNERDTSAKFGLGLQYDFNPYVGIRAEAERFRVDNTVSGKDNVDLYSIGVVFRFAKAPAPPPPRPVTPEPRPAPVVAPPPPPRPAPPSPAPEVVAPPPPPPPPVQQQAPRRDRN